MSTALAPTLIGALFLAAPRPAGTGAGGAGNGVGSVGGGSGAGVSTPARVADVPAKTVVAEELAGRPCSPIGARRPTPGRPSAAISVRGVLSRDGEHVGRRLSLRSGQGIDVVVNLPAESFVNVEAGDWLVYGLSSRRDSEVRAVDLETGCDTRLARLAGIARGAVLSADGATLYTHVLDAGTRADLGVSRVDLSSGAAAPAMPPFIADEGFGAVFATTLVMGIDGNTLAVQSCGADACHTRLLDTASGAIRVHDQRHGGLVGVTATHLYAFAAGHERPAELLAIARDGSGVAVAAEEAYDAELAGSAAQPVLRYETADGWREVAP